MANFIDSLTPEQTGRLSATDLQLLQELQNKADGVPVKSSFIERRLEELKQEAVNSSKYKKEMEDSFC